MRCLENEASLISNANGEPARRLALSRLVGHRYRVNQREQTSQLQNDINRLKQEIEQQRVWLLMKRKQDRVDDHSSTHNFSTPTAKILCCASTTGAAALLLLELIAMRRNLFCRHSMNLAATLECPNEQAVYEVVLNADADAVYRADKLHTAWACHEAMVYLDDDKLQREKKCTRCGKSRTAGSGHPRSTCDDGLKVGSMIRYNGKYM